MQFTSALHRQMLMKRLLYQAPKLKDKPTEQVPLDVEHTKKIPHCG